MKADRESARQMLLHIAYHLDRQNQAVTREALGLHSRLDFETCDVEQEVGWLVAHGLFTLDSAGNLFLTQEGSREGARISKAKTKEEFEQLARRSSDSPAYLDLCEELTGHRLCVFNMMDKPQLDFVLGELEVSRDDTVLDLGCGVGSILDALVRKRGCTGVGIDRLSASVVKKCSPRIVYLEADFTAFVELGTLRPSLTLAVDSLYFSGDLDGILSYLGRGGSRLCLFYSQYDSEPARPGRGILGPDDTTLAASLKRVGLAYRAVDFSANEHSFYEHGLRVLPGYQTSFESEGNSALYERRKRDFTLGKEIYDAGLGHRYLYLVE